ncbi:hypothetical protein B0J11DRAFT_526777 [Dendryphion nanum]|uniref:Uncharacterized protein n=1 Tax=Dendryphion nanum TaxID=256645 RepID=A0A9P9DXK5_9PLEO|nr:hypothetical protein B0J11DRAFT_526777 [Dendryphion nanum]
MCTRQLFVRGLLILILTWDLVFRSLDTIVLLEIGFGRSLSITESHFTFWNQRLVRAFSIHLCRGIGTTVIAR